MSCTMVRGRFITREEVGLGSIEGSSFQNRQDGSLQLGTLQDYVERYGYEPKNPFKSPPATEIVRVDDPECESHHDKTVRLYCDMMDLPLSGKAGQLRRRNHPILPRMRGERVRDLRQHDAWTRP
jgi:hypothetical protein